MRRYVLAAAIGALLHLSTPGQGEAFGPPAAVTAPPAAPLLLRVADAEHQRVARAQQRLRALGLYHGTTNGTLGPQTRDALSDYQRRLSFPVTGQLDERTAYALDNNDLLRICAARGVAAGDCLDAIRQFHAALPETGPGSSSGTGDLDAEKACAGEKDVSDCTSAVAEMSAWLSGRASLPK